MSDNKARHTGSSRTPANTACDTPDQVKFGLLTRNTSTLLPSRRSRHEFRSFSDFIIFLVNRAKGERYIGAVGIHELLAASPELKPAYSVSVGSMSRIQNPEAVVVVSSTSVANVRVRA